MLEYLKLEKVLLGVVFNKLEVFFNKVMVLNWLKIGLCSSKLIGIDDFFFFDLKYLDLYRKGIVYRKYRI